MIDLTALEAMLKTHEPVSRIVVAETAGSTPRETGASMLVWCDALGQIEHSGTVGGGALEWQAIAKAASLLPNGTSAVTRHSLGPALGQCCGGSVTLFTEVFTQATLSDLAGQLLYARPLDSAHNNAMPLSVSRILAKARAQGQSPISGVTDGWIIEALQAPQIPLWIWGAGHVGRALVEVFAPLKQFKITWIDVAPDRFPIKVSPSITQLWAENISSLTDHAPSSTHHLVLTYSHTLDLELCHRLLKRGFSSLGLIGSQTKWVRFSRRLAKLGHPPHARALITCPIGDPMLGKEPYSIALGVGAKLLRLTNHKNSEASENQKARA
ncbi:MAG: xanthine dehydrogenase accessory factor [Paracoccaceae bacterium]|jgi:xanthine dehydrogenase accessory factor